VYDQVMHRLRAVPGVDAVGTATTSVFPLTRPEGGHDPAAVAPVGVSTRADGWPLAYYGYATPGYFETMGIPLVAGRAFRNADASVEVPGAIISQSLAHDLFGDADPIGRPVAFADWRSFWHSTPTVVGVVGDVPGTTMRAGRSRAIYLPHVFPLAANVSTETFHPYVPRFETYVIRTGRDFVTLVPELRRAVREVDPRLPVLDISSLDAIIVDATAQERFALRLLLVSAGAAVFLAIVGIYGVLAYSVRRRTTEIGVRIALGASPQRVIRLVVFQGAWLSAAGIAAGLAGALLLTRFIASLLYGTSPTDPLTFAAMTLVLFGVALVASYIPARRASRIDPAHAIRGE
jgi:predicted permease